MMMVMMVMMVMMMMMQAKYDGAAGGAENDEVQGRKTDSSRQRLLTHLQLPTEMGQLLL